LEQPISSSGMMADVLRCLAKQYKVQHVFTILLQSNMGCSRHHYRYSVK